MTLSLFVSEILKCNGSDYNAYLDLVRFIYDREGMSVGNTSENWFYFKILLKTVNCVKNFIHI